MIKSMTGYGTAEKTDFGKKLTVEIKSVNHRYNDMTGKTPRNFGYLEDAVRKALSSKIARGKIDVYVGIESVGEEECAITADLPLARGYYNAVKAIVDDLGLEDNVSVGNIIRFTDVFKVEKLEDDNDSISCLAGKVALMAAEKFNEMTTIEGEKLFEDMSGQLDAISSFVADIEKRAPLIVTEYKERIEGRMRELLDGVSIDEGRLLNEVAIFADRVNINEEIIRLKSHISQVLELISGSEPVGRKLDFIIQEMNREINTIGSKSNDLEVAKIVIEVKSGIEKLREQVQNVE